MYRAAIFSWIILNLVVISISAQNETNQELNTNRTQKALSVFQVVRFPNTICAGSGGSYNGTCFTSSECSQKGGTASGSCASSFGVCCIFVLSCGGIASQNCTYFQSSTSAQTSGQCSIKICKCSSDICQIRLDFNSFVITGPTTVTLSIGYQIGGSITGYVNQGGKPISVATQCLTDTFSLTGPAGSTPPAICGTNTGEHMYVDATDACNTAAFQLGQTAIGTTLATRAWSIKISQISCYDTNLAPSGCTQFLYGQTSGMIQSFNYANQFQLANQNQRICFRRERGYCRLCFSAAIASDFAVSGGANIATVKGSICCGYGSKGTKTTGYDCVIIPGASKATANKNPAPNSICGNGKGLIIVTAAGASKTSTTVCTSQTPFMLNFLTDAWTMETITTTVYRGFKLDWFEVPC